jgi:two-component system chemotaxis response regulator CheY
MPGLSGLDILNTIKADDDLKSTFFMMVTASSEMEMEKVKQAIASGIDGYIIKPFQANVLYEKIISIFE